MTLLEYIVAQEKKSRDNSRTHVNNEVSSYFHGHADAMRRIANVIRLIGDGGSESGLERLDAGYVTPPVSSPEDKK